MAGVAVAKAGSAISGTTKGIGGTISNLIKLIFFVKARWSITIILILIFSWNAFIEAKETKSLAPLVFEIGGRLASPDETLYYQLKEIEENNWQLPTKSIEPNEKEGLLRDIKSIWSRIVFVISIFSIFWFCYVTYYSIYWIASRHSEDEKFHNFLTAIIFLILIQALFAEAMLYINSSELKSNEDKIKDVVFTLRPFKGITFLVMNFGDIMNMLISPAIPYIPELNNTIKT